MNLEKANNNQEMIIKYQNTDNVLKDVCSIIESARDYAYKSVNIALVERNWFIGYRIAEEELKSENRADYGTEIIKKLSKELKGKYGKGFDARNLYYFFKFYKMFPNILNTVCAKSNIVLSWSHYRTLLQIEDEKVRDWYAKKHYLMDKLEFIKNPIIAEFLGYSLEDKYTETELETSIINNLQKFLMELRQRLCFCRKATTYSYRKGRLLH